MSGIAEANEAMLTGESDLVLKEVGDELLSGSYIASGQVYARVKRVGGKQLCQQTDDGSQNLEAYQFAYSL